MGSSDSGGTNGLLDCSIGTIVWVRRRNGSWWPGKILGVDELSASHLMSPRSGTPVKLLGREDASVDWYNLEKSKRVKAFRCGEFDECIERAEASLGLPSKKREKYARREDAILHALELEKEILEKKYGKGGAKPFNAICGSSGKDMRSSSIALRNGNGKHEATEDECNSNLLPAQKVEGVAWQNSFNSQCFSLPKKTGSFALSPSHEATNDDQAEAVSAGCIDSGNSTDKGKGLIDGSIEESSIRRRDRRRPLYQVMQNNAELARDGDRVKRRRLLYLQSQSTHMVDAEGDSFSQMGNLSSHRGLGNYYHADTFAKEASSGSSEDTESDSSETDSMEHYSHIDTTAFSDVYTPMTLQSRALNSMQEDQPSTSSSESDESSHQDSPHFHRKDPVSLNTEISRWQLKGKRNTRSFSRRSSDKFSYGTYLEPRSLNQQTSHNLSYYHDHDNYINEVDLMEDDLNQYMWKFNSHYNGLFDVDLKVQGNYQWRVHVPFVSLTSRLNGKSIIGHPIQVETLLDGSTDDLVSFGDFESGDGNTAPPSWTTARRTTSFRVPRPHLSSHLDDFDYQQDQRNTNGKKKNSARKKPPKRSISTTSQKIRPLSSIGMEPRQHSRLISYMKPLDSGPPIVACIPVKLVFSRLLEAIGRPPFMPSNKGLGEQKQVEDC